MPFVLPVVIVVLRYFHCIRVHFCCCDVVDIAFSCLCFTKVI